MKKERKNLILLLGILLFLLGITMFIALKIDKLPSMQRSVNNPVCAPEIQNLESSMLQAAELIQRQELNQAIDLLQYIIKKYPDESEPRMRLGAVYYQQKNYAKAEQTFRDLILKAPGNAAAYNHLSETLLRQDRLPEAQSAIDKAVELAPDNYGILLNASALYARMNKDEKAIELLQQALSRGATPGMVTRYRELIKLQERPAFKQYFEQQKTNR